MDFKIKQIEPQETLPIRHQVMWPTQPLEYVKLSNDKEGRHYGLFVAEVLVSIISLFNKNKSVQFRKFATLIEYQGKGYGSELLKFVIDLIEKEGHEKIWCNARINKTGYYTKFGLQETNTRFEKGGIEYVIMEMNY